RPGVNHHGDGAGLEPPGMCHRAVENLLDLLDLDEVVAPADAPDLPVAAEAVVRAHEVRQTEDAASREAAASLDPVELVAHAEFPDERPQPFVQVCRRIEHSFEAGSEHRVP